LSAISCFFWTMKITRIKMNNKSRQQGFTLIELMITVAIIGILSSVAVPSYMSYVTKSKRTEAKTEVLRIAQLQESYYVQNLSYAKKLNGTGGLGFSSTWRNTETELYRINTQGLPTSCDGTNNSPCSGYRITAQPIVGNGQDNDEKCTRFRLDNTGKKGAKGTGGSGFYNAAVIKECWG